MGLRRVVTLLGLLTPDDSKIVAATRIKVLSSYPLRTTDQSSDLQVTGKAAKFLLCYRHAHMHTTFLHLLNN